MRKTLKLTGAFLLLGAMVTTGFVASRSPSLTRTWDEDVRVLAGVEFAADETVHMTNIRDWHYTQDSVVSKDYFDASFDPSDIVELWFYEQQLDDVGLIAHTFIVFEFDESYGPGRYLGLSVETRRESGEEYSLVGGVMRAFEVTHIWATEADLVTRRVQLLDYPLTRYWLDISDEVLSRLFVRMANETSELATIPRWYNTALNNCSSALIKYVNESEPDAIPRHYSYVLTGKVDDYLEKLGYLDPGYSLAITREFLAANPLR